MPTYCCPCCKAGIEAENNPEKCPGCHAIISKIETNIEEDTNELTSEILPWQPRFEFGHQLIDAQHRELCSLINELYRAVRFNQYREGFVLSVITRIEDFVRKHFAEEEQIFSSTKYPSIKDHVREHREFMLWFLTLRAKSKSSFVELKPVLRHLVEWFIRHTQTSDRGYLPYL